MNTEKQIDEMAKDLCHTETCEIKKIGITCNHRCKAHIYATRAIAKGYRKADEVVSEVITKAKAIFCPDCDYDVADIRYNLDWLEAELKKKYTEEPKQ